MSYTQKSYEKLFYNNLIFYTIFECSFLANKLEGAFGDVRYHFWFFKRIFHRQYIKAQ
jgi:hypothetical protein